MELSKFLGNMAIGLNAVAYTSDSVAIGNISVSEILVRGSL
jgi:hypothetical protein